MSLTTKRYRFDGWLGSLAPFFAASWAASLLAAVDCCLDASGLRTSIDTSIPGLKALLKRSRLSRISSRAKDSLTVTVHFRRTPPWASSRLSARRVELLETVSGERGDSMDSLSRLVRLDWRRCDQCGRRAIEDEGAALRDMGMGGEEEGHGRVAVPGLGLRQVIANVMFVDRVLLYLKARAAIDQRSCAKRAGVGGSWPWPA